MLTYTVTYWNLGPAQEICARLRHIQLTSSMSRRSVNAHFLIITKCTRIAVNALTHSLTAWLMRMKVANAPTYMWRNVAVNALRKSSWHVHLPQSTHAALQCIADGMLHACTHHWQSSTMYSSKGHLIRHLHHTSVSLLLLTFQSGDMIVHRLHTCTYSH